MQHSVMKKILYEVIINKNIQALHNCTDWYALLSCSISEKLEGYLFKIFVDNNLIRDVPKPIGKTLYINYQYNREKNSHYNKEFQIIRQLLLENGVHIFPYKGLFLIDNIYKDYGIRYMEDMDIISCEKNFNTIKILLEKLGYQLALINDTEKSLYISGEPITSCLFIKEYPATSLVPLSKMDISFVSMPLKEYTSPYLNHLELLPEYNFVLLCKSFFIDTYKKNKNLVPENCHLGKLVDIIKFIDEYPKETKYIFNSSSFSTTEFIEYTKQCISYFSRGNKI